MEKLRSISRRILIAMLLLLLFETFLAGPLFRAGILPRNQKAYWAIEFVLFALLLTIPSVYRRLRAGRQISPAPAVDAPVPEEEKEDPEYVERVTSAANAGNPDAQYALSMHLFEGQRGIPQDIPSAIEWLRKAAAAGQTDALFQLGGRSFLGMDMACDPTSFCPRCKFFAGRALQ